MDVIRETTTESVIRMMRERRKFVLDVRAEWCHPCKIMDKSLQKLSNEFNDLDFYSIDYDKNSDIFDVLEIGTVPYLVFSRDGLLVRRVKGFSNENTLREALHDFSR